MNIRSVRTQSSQHHLSGLYRPIHMDFQQTVLHSSLQKILSRKNCWMSCWKNFQSSCHNLLYYRCRLRFHTHDIHNQKKNQSFRLQRLHPRHTEHLYLNCRCSPHYHLHCSHHSFHHSVTLLLPVRQLLQQLLVALFLFSQDRHPPIDARSFASARL